MNLSARLPPRGERVPPMAVLALNLPILAVNNQLALLMLGQPCFRRRWRAFSCCALSRLSGLQLLSLASHPCVEVRVGSFPLSHLIRCPIEELPAHFDCCDGFGLQCED